MALLSVFEYQKVAVGDFDISANVPSLTSAQADLLTSFKARHGFDVFKYINGKTISAQQYVGVCQLGTLTIEVLPKIDAAETTNVRRNLVAMIAETLNLPIKEGDLANVGTQSHGILEILIKLFSNNLFDQVKRGLVRRYERREENLSVLRGKLGVVEQIRWNAGNPERLYCRYDEFLEDNPLNQILKAAVRLLLKASRDVSNQRRLAELLLVFDGVSNMPRQSLAWGKVVFDRMNERYRSAYKLAELFLKETPPDVTGGVAHGFSLFFDMNRLFEEYIGCIARKVFTPIGYQVSLQGPQKFLAFDLDSDHPVFAMKPDVVGTLNGDVAWVIDTKWKPLSLQKTKEGVQQDDLYQMYAYANCYKCSDVVLLYPHHHELDGHAGLRSTFGLNLGMGLAGEKKRLVKIATVDLTDLKLVPAQLFTVIFGVDAVSMTAVC